MKVSAKRDMMGRFENLRPPFGEIDSRDNDRVLQVTNPRFLAHKFGNRPSQGLGLIFWLAYKPREIADGPCRRRWPSRENSGAVALEG